MANGRPQIALVTSVNARDRRSLSGLPYYVAKSLQEHCGDVHHLGPLESSLEIPLKLASLLVRMLSLNQSRYRHAHSVLLSKAYARILERTLLRSSFDVIFAPGGSTLIAHLKTELPIIYLSDATFGKMTGYYHRFTGLINSSLRAGNYLESLAIQKASLILYPSRWAAESACKDYSAQRAKIRVIPFGANIEEAPDRNCIKARFAKKAGKCKLLFIGTDWKRKGGDLAFETMRKLVQGGTDSELIVCGCTPPRQIQHRNLRVIEFLDKNVPEQRRDFLNLLMDADFLLLPTRSECFGHVFCEANAAALPVITTDTGGVSSIVRTGINGYCLPISATAFDYADLIRRIHLDRELYRRLVISSREEYDQRLNWDAWGKSVRKTLDGIIRPSGRVQLQEGTGQEGNFESATLPSV